MIGTLTWSLRIGNMILQATAGSLNIDDQNIPAITASATVPFDAEFLGRLDPRSTNVPRVTLIGEFSAWSTGTLADISAYATAQGPTLADLSAAWADLGTGQLRDVSEHFGAPLHASAPEAPESMALDLHVREVVYDDYEMTVTLASDEALLTDWAIANADDYAAILDIQLGMNVQQVQTYVDPVLLAVLGYRTNANVYNTTPLSGPANDVIQWRQDMTAWELMRLPLEDTDLKLRVNPSGRGFTLQRPENPINSPAEHAWLWTRADALDVKHTFTRSGDWYDSAMLTQGDGLDFTFASYPAKGAHSRTYTERFPDGTKLSSSMAENIARRSANRGQLIDLVLPIELGVFMRDEFAYAPTLDDTPEQWIVKSVSYDFATAQMRVRGEQRY